MSIHNINFAQPQDNPTDGYARDKKTKALLNVDAMSYKAYKQQRASQGKVNEISTEINKLKEDVALIKELLLKIANGNNNG